MTRKYYEDGSDRMVKNSEQNKDFERAAREAGLSESQKNDFRDLLHDEKEFQTGDRTHQELLDLANEVKK